MNNLHIPTIFYAHSTRNQLAVDLYAKLGGIAEESKKYIVADPESKKGSPTISEEIYRQIEVASIAVVDVTPDFYASNEKEHVLNAHVLVELGYILKTHDENSLILLCVNNTIEIEKLPKFIESRKIITYDDPENKYLLLHEEILDILESQTKILNEAKQKSRELIDIITPIKGFLESMERSVPAGSESMTDLRREIQLEMGKFIAGKFQGEHLIPIRALVMENYSKNQIINQPHFGQIIINYERQIMKIMDEVKKRFPNEFIKDIPRIIELDISGTEKDDILFRRCLDFGYAAKFPYYSRYWNDFLNIYPEDWKYLKHIKHNEELPPAEYIRKCKKEAKPSTQAQST